MPTATDRAGLADRIERHLPVRTPDEAAALDDTLAAGANRFQTFADLVTEEIPDAVRRFDDLIADLDPDRMVDLGLLPRAYRDQEIPDAAVEWVIALSSLSRILDTGGLTVPGTARRAAATVLADFAEASTEAQTMTGYDDPNAAGARASADRTNAAARRLISHLREGIWK